MSRAWVLGRILFLAIGVCACKQDASSFASSSPTASTSSARATTTPVSSAYAAAKAYQDIEGRFEIAMPAAPKVERSMGKLATKQVELSTKTSDATYYLMQLEFPEGIQVNVPGAFTGAQADICKQDALTVTSQREFAFTGGYAARDVVAASEGAKPWKDVMRFVYVPPRMYSILVRGVTDEAKAQAFVDSFHVLDTSAGATTWVTGELGPGKASFPEAPVRAVRKQAGPDGPMDVHTLRVTRGTMDMGIQLVVDPKPGPETKADIQARLDGARDVFLKGFGGPTVALDERMVLGGHPARHLKLAMTEHRGTVEIGIAFPKPDTMIVGMVSLGELPSAADVADAKKFIDSFAISPDS